MCCGALSASSGSARRVARRQVGRRVGFIALLIWGAVFMTLWVYAASDIWLWVFGLAWSFGFLGFWGPSTTSTAEIFPTRIRGVANGAVWFIGYFVGFVLWPFATVALQQATGSFALAFHDDTGFHGCDGRGRVVYRPRARRQGAQRHRRLSSTETSPRSSIYGTNIAPGWTLCQPILQDPGWQRSCKQLASSTSMNCRRSTHRAATAATDRASVRHPITSTMVKLLNLTNTTSRPGGS